MRNLFFIASLLFCQSSFCQEYVFDKVFEYSGSSNYYSKKTTYDIFINSKNNNYILVFANRADKILKYVYDNYLGQVHYLTFETINNETDFKYLYTSKYEANYNDLYCSGVKTKIEKNDGEFYKIVHSQYHKDKVTKEIQIICKPYEGANVVSIAKNFNNHFLFCDVFPISQNYLPTQIKYSSTNKDNTVHKSIYNLVLIKDTEIYISINKEKLKFD